MKKIITVLAFILLFMLKSNNISFAQSSCIGTAGQVKWGYWQGFRSQPDSTELTTLEFYPTQPDGFQMMGSLQSPINYVDNFAALIRGFIKVPQTATYQFNITGDDKAIFYLSTNDQPTNKRKRAEVKTWTNVTEHNKEANQTSTAITLQANQYYYFEMLNLEGGGGDHMTTHWRKTTDTDTTWRIIDFNYIYDYACGLQCPPRGTACNDNNPQTTNDQQDGFCNCLGVVPTANACVGQRAVVDAYYYDNIVGSYIENDLINAPKFPLLPDRREKLKGAYGPLVTYTNENYGTLVQGYLTVPVSGTYEFNITGDNQTFFFLSKNDSIEYKQYHQAIVVSGVAETSHTSSSLQNIAPLFLEKGKYYYFEFRHKENTWRDHFNLYWKTPFHEKKEWKKVSNFYLFDYQCELSCIPQGTPCDDGNAFTNNDQINASCECVGTPCSGADCDDLGARYKMYETCSPTQNLTTREDASWVACNANATNPNPTRAAYNNWIKYDFAHQYKFQSTRVWNYNVTNETDRGFKNVVIDYSLDGTNWTSLGGVYTWNQASGTSDYSGFAGPNFNNLKAKHILITAQSNWNDPTCMGFSKITFDALHCDPEGTPCDDQDPLTTYDKFDNNCNCKGIDIRCANDTLSLERMSLTTNGLYEAKKQITTQSTVPATANISFTAGNSIVLLPGFEVKQEGVFLASIADCMQAAFVKNTTASTATLENSEASLFEVDSTANLRLKEIIFRLKNPSKVKLVVKDNNENVLVTLIDHYIENIGTHKKWLPVNKLPKGTYWVELTVEKNVMKEKLVL
jgi:PA14 domain